MTAGQRIGWTLFALVILALAAFASMVRIVPGPAQSAEPQAAAASPAPPRASEPSGQPGTLTVPVVGVARAAITDSWGDPRANGQREHHGTDILAPAGTPVVAAAPGTVEKLFFSHGGGGTTLYVRSPDRRWSYYYAHLAGYAEGVHEGQQVRAGDPLGFVGDSGNAGAGNYHLHFGMSRMRPDEKWYQGSEIDPYPLLAGRGAGR